MAKDSNNFKKSIKIDEDTKIKLDEFYIETSGMKTKSYDDKISFLLWFYSSHKNNNGSV